MICPHLQIRIEITTTFFMVIHCCVLVDVSKLYSFFSSFTCLLIVSIIRSVIRMGFLLIPITLHAELLCMGEYCIQNYPPPSSLGHKYSAAKVLMLSILFVVSSWTAYTYDFGGYEGNTIFLPVTICLGDITGCTPTFLLIELIIFTVETPSSLISQDNFRFISFESINRTHLILSFANLIPFSMKGTCKFVSQQY